MKKKAKKPVKSAASKKTKKAASSSGKASKKAPKALKLLGKGLKKVLSLKEKIKPGKVPPIQAKLKASKNPKDKKAELLNQLTAAQQKKAQEEVVLTNAEGKQYCRVHDCDNESTTDGYCRFHYLALWKRNKIKTKILQGGKLDKYIEDLTSKYPDKYLEMLRKDLASEKDFNLIITEMDVEDSNEDSEAEEDTSRFIEEVRGVPSGDDDEGGFG